jgi:hypothetical protein
MILISHRLWNLMFLNPTHQCPPNVMVHISRRFDTPTPNLMVRNSTFGSPFYNDYEALSLPNLSGLTEFYDSHHSLLLKLNGSSPSTFGSC